MSKSRGTTLCDCGHDLSLKNSFTRALYFEEYLILLGIKDIEEYPFFFEFQGMICCGVLCPNCDTKYLYWIGGTHYIKEENRNYQIHIDTSYWETFSGDKE